MCDKVDYNRLDYARSKQSDHLNAMINNLFQGHYPKTNKQYVDDFLSKIYSGKDFGNYVKNRKFLTILFESTKSYKHKPFFEDQQIDSLNREEV